MPAWLRVERVAKGSYREFGEPAREAARARKLQRQVVGGRALEMTGAASVDALDPTGAFQLAGRRQEEYEAGLAQRARQEALPAEELRAIEAAGQDVTRDEEAEVDLEQRRRRRLLEEMAEEEELRNGRRDTDT